MHGTIPENAKRMFEYTGVDGIMIGRGAIGNPWIFEQLKYFFENNEKMPRPTNKEKYEIIKEHLELNLKENEFNEQTNASNHDANISNVASSIQNAFVNPPDNKSNSANFNSHSNKNTKICREVKNGKLIKIIKKCNARGGNDNISIAYLVKDGE